MKFRALVLPVFVAVLISISALIAVAVIAVVEQDRIALDNERKVLLHATRLIERKLEDLAIDSAWWDVAVENLYLHESTDWADITIGDTITKIPAVDGVLILRPNGDILYAKIHEGDVPADKLADTLSPLIQNMSLQQGPDAMNKRGYVSVLGRTVAYGASMVRPNGVNNFSDPLPDKMPVLIFFGSVTQTRLKEIGIENGIRDVAINYNRVAADGLLTLYDFNTAPVATIRWTSSTPGSHLLDRLQLPMVPILGIIILALVYFIRQALILLKELEKANRSKSAFLASMSHEIRTPLNSILGFTELVSMEMFGKVEGEKNAEYLKLIRESGEHLLSIINDILDLSKLEAGKYDIHAEAIKIQDIVDTCIHMVAATAEDRGIKLVHTIEDATLMSDERIMRQIVLNLLSNALKFTPRGGFVEVRGQRKRDHYNIDVKDNGIGMTAEQITLALTPFGQVENEYSKSHSGTGLGLPIVKRFTALLDGRLAISSRPEYGTTVSLIFPYKTKPKLLK